MTANCGSGASKPSRSKCLFFDLTFGNNLRMKNSLVVLDNLTATCTELARHLVLSGINIWLRDASGAVITQEDVETDFLCAEADIGLKVSIRSAQLTFVSAILQRGQVIKNKLSEMNPFVEIEFLEETETPIAHVFAEATKKQRKISAVIHGFAEWESSAKLNAEVRNDGNDAAFYAVSSSGLYGFAFADLGASFSYEFAVKDGSAGQENRGPDQQKMESKTLTDSLSLQTFLDVFEDRSRKLAWRRRGKQPGKMLFAAFMAQYLKEKTS